MDAVVSVSKQRKGSVEGHAVPGSENAGTAEGPFSSNALQVLRNRYLKKDEHGQIVETPREMFQRVARHVSSVESEAVVWEQRFFDLMWTRKFMPNSPTLMNAGRPLGMLSACFVLPLNDSIADIMETARQIALVQRAGGGTGIDLSRLRPSGSIVRSSGGTTEGPLSFLKMLSAVTDAIQQGAFRRGANMGTMRLDHPDILKFIRLKEDLSKITNYNLSCTTPDSFMEDVKQDPDGLHVVVNPHDGRKAWLGKADDRADYGAYERGDAECARFWTRREVMDIIVQKAWESGEPGLVFLDRVNEANPTPQVGEMTTTNPCGEQPLLPFEACNLGSLNLAAYHVPDPDGPGRIDHEALDGAVGACVRFLDDVVEVNHYPTAEIDAMCRANRKIGLGVMGWADLLFKLRIPYDSEEALELARKVGGRIQRVAWDENTRLAEEKGVFANWRDSRWDKVAGRKMRNAHCVTIAPTGTISIIAGCSGGIEPIFSLAFKRQVMSGTIMTETNPVFLAALRDAGFGVDEIDRVVEYAAEHGTIDDVDVELPVTVRRVFRSARDISPQWHVRMQAAWQEHTDAAVSKTINFSADASTEDVERAYRLAYELGCKGITVYRDGSRSHQPMALDSKATGTKNSGSASEPAGSTRKVDRDAVIDMLLEG